MLGMVCPQPALKLRAESAAQPLLAELIGCIVDRHAGVHLCANGPALLDAMRVVRQPQPARELLPIAA
jgi:hypothetical protein